MKKTGGQNICDGSSCEIQYGDSDENKQLYGGIDAQGKLLTYYNKAFVTPCFRVPHKVQLPSSGISTDGTIIFEVPKEIDFIEKACVLLAIPKIFIKKALRGKFAISLTRNFGNNVIRTVDMRADSKTFAALDTYTLDDYLESGISRDNVRDCLSYGIGNRKNLIEPQSKLIASDIKVNLPFWFGDHISQAFANCCADKSKIEFKLNCETDLTKLIKLQRVQDTPNGPIFIDMKIKDSDLAQYVDVEDNKPLKIETIDLWLNCGRIKQNERANHKQEPKKVLIKYNETIIEEPSQSPQQTIDLSFSGVVSHFTFKAINVDAEKIHNYSNYTTEPVNPSIGVDPVSKFSLKYNSKSAVDKIDGHPAHLYSENEYADKAPNVPRAAGYHLVSYADKIDGLNQSGSVDLADLKASLTLYMSDTNQNVKEDFKNNLTSAYQPVVTATCFKFIILKNGKVYTSETQEF